MRLLSWPVMLVLAVGCAAPQGPPPTTTARPDTKTGEAEPQGDSESGGAGGQSSGDRRPDLTRRKVIKTAQLKIITSHLQDGFTKATDLARRMGGYTLSSERGENHVELDLRIPAHRFEEALCRLGKLGKVDRRQISGQDVTARHVDLTLRLRNAERMHQRYIELLARAKTVTETLEVQREIERVTNTIESLRGQINLIDNQVGLSTIHLNLRQPTRPGPLGWVFYGLYKGLVWLFVW